MREAEWWVLLPCAYVIGGTVNHSLQLAVHELSHDLCWAGPNKDAANRLTAIMANLPTCFPSGQTFKPYHMDHHQYQGVDGVDTDIPHAFELYWVTNTIGKILWIAGQHHTQHNITHHSANKHVSKIVFPTLFSRDTMRTLLLIFSLFVFLLDCVCSSSLFVSVLCVAAQPLCYALRPMLIKPKPFRFWEGLNWVAQIAFNVGIVYFLGLKSFTYLITGTLLGLGLHPSAGHFIAEHYEFVQGHETYSYYGIANYLNFNVGYHNEHHDFPRIPWSKLPLVRKIAPEFYDHLPCYHSYITEVFLPYIMDPNMGVWCRVKRTTSHKILQALDKTTEKRKFAPFKVACFVGMIGSVVFILASLIFGASSSSPASPAKQAITLVQAAQS